jgi:DNA-binding XRE family transcriptional regulator
MATLALPTMLKADRELAGLSVARAAWLLGVSVRIYRLIESGEEYPSFDVWNAICERLGWAQTFVAPPGGRSPRLRLSASLK